VDARSEELLRAIAANPADNEPRLAFAEHIASESPAHAAMIVAQCTGKASRAELEAFVDELPAVLRGLDLDNNDDDDAPGQGFRPVRGFLELAHWVLEQRDFVEVDPDVLFRIAPTCKGLLLQDVSDFDAVGARLRRFEALRITSTHFDNATGLRLAAAQGFSHLRELRFDANYLDDTTLSAIYDTLPVLEQLSVGSRRNASSELDALRHTACARGARELTYFGASGEVLDLGGFSAVRDLTAHICSLDAGFAALPNRFHALTFYTTTFTADFRAALNESRTFSKLRALALVGSGPREALLGLLASPGFGPLRSLHVNDNEVEDVGYLVQALGNLVGSLEELHFDLETSEDALRTLAQTPFTRLYWLALKAPITPGAAHALATAPWIHGLRSFDFDVSLLDDASAVALAGALSPDCQKTLRGDSYEEVFDAFGVHSEDIVDDEASQ
jgi:uncharacterized protein (TIGR02996 family)